MAANKNGDASAARGANLRLHFSVSLNMALLREVLAENPFRDPSQWHHVARNLQESTGKTVTTRSARERIDLLIYHYASEDRDRANLRKSGTENEYNEREHLLQEVLDLAREFSYKVRVRKKAPLGERAARRLANETRGAAAARYEETSQTTGPGAIAESPLALFSEMTGDAMDDEASSSSRANKVNCVSGQYR
ncbi:hypothetical protein MTO96_000406 [Rhipicephalus appendiculatus]